MVGLLVRIAHRIMWTLGAPLTEAQRQDEEAAADEEWLRSVGVRP